MNAYPVGDVTHLNVIFTANGAATDPSTVTLYIKGPTINLLEYTYAGGGVVRDGMGLYHYDFTVPASGQYYYRFEGAGTVVAAVEGSFLGGPSYFK